MQGETHVPTPQQHTTLLYDLTEQLAALPSSGAMKAGRKPYRALRTERAIKAREDDPAALLAYVTKIAFQPTSEALSALVTVDRLDLSIEYLVADKGKVYAPLFSDDARAAARAKLGGWHEQVGARARERAEAELAEDRRIIDVINRQRTGQGKGPLTEQQAQSVLQSRSEQRTRKNAC
jgi:hypothetical protein